MQKTIGFNFNKLHIKKQLIILFLFFCVGCISCKHDRKIHQELSVSIIAEIGINEAKTKEEGPYQFSFIRSVDCDETGNIYILDHVDVCVKIFNKNGTFIRRILSEGEGPREMVNPYLIKINPFNKRLFILHEHGRQLKEFDTEGNFVKQYKLLEQIVHNFEFYDRNTLVYVSKGISGEDEYKSIKLLDLNTIKVIREFAPTKRPMIINGYQRIVLDDDILWTCPGDMMELVGFDLTTGDIRNKVSLDVAYKPHIIIKNNYAPGQGWISAQIFNFAQPFRIHDTIFVFLTQQEYPEYDQQERPPAPILRRIRIFKRENSELIEVGRLPDMGYFYNIEACWQNRIIASCSAYALVPKILIFEIEMN